MLRPDTGAMSQRCCWPVPHKWFLWARIRGGSLLPACEWWICYPETIMKWQYLMPVYIRLNLIVFANSFWHVFKGTVHLKIYLLVMYISFSPFSPSVLRVLLYPLAHRLWSLPPGELWAQSALPHAGLRSILHHHPQHQERSLRGLRKRPLY